MILVCFLIILAAFFNAVMDKTKDTIQFENSIFKNKNPLFWDDQQSDGVFIPHTRYKVNAWHLSKSLVLFILLGLLPIAYDPFCIRFLGKIFSYPKITGAILDIAIMGTLWIQVFNLFYNNILKSKK